jgi:trigger factor
MLQAQADALADQDLNDSLIREVVNRATVHYPDEMVEREVSAQMEDLIRNLESRSLTLQDYLAAQKQDLAQLQTELREQALQRLSTTLVLLDLARENEITVTEKDVEGEVKARAEAEDVKLSQMRRLLNDTGEIDTIRNRIFFRKITELLREKAEIREVEG